MQFVTADTHFFHKDLLGVDDFAPRPFASVSEMNQTIIDHWNTKVGENDVVYHLGDIALYFIKPPKKAYDAIFQVLNQLHGHLVLIKGNHDSRALFKYLEQHNYVFNGREKFEFHDVGKLIKYDHRQYYMTHYPLLLGIAPQIINLHGHIHHNAVPIKENINVGVDSPELDYLSEKVQFGAPLSMKEIEEIVEGKRDDFLKRG
ncbi:MAG: metallophosphoesterase [[Lactobacillus] timonensis]|jgi:calcineurin-like phosphoesterase family protein|uniref:metallophosphoesterase n=1 Tax=[Lactobacillus] timonensis TaxID=1970790 RepID=UPI000C8657A5|nr:metallophosphoesterase [[Lactobacillus] timonensis]MCI1288015.1 metallophosphoesterase [[Lactobacillus] timonensis]